MGWQEADEGDFDALIETGIVDPIAIGLAESLLQEAEIPYIVMSRYTTVHRDSIGGKACWAVRVPRVSEADAREILESVEETERRA